MVTPLLNAFSKQITVARDARNQVACEGNGVKRYDACGDNPRAWNSHTADFRVLFEGSTKGEWKNFFLSREQLRQFAG
jgi:hypothetical protein